MSLSGKHCAEMTVFRMYMPGVSQIVKILGFWGHESLPQLTDYAIIVGKQPQAICRQMAVARFQ